VKKGVVIRAINIKKLEVSSSVGLKVSSSVGLKVSSSVGLEVLAKLHLSKKKNNP